MPLRERAQQLGLLQDGRLSFRYRLAGPLSFLSSSPMNYAVTFPRLGSLTNDARSCLLASTHAAFARLNALAGLSFEYDRDAQVPVVLVAIHDPTTFHAYLDRLTDEQAFKSAGQEPADSFMLYRFLFSARNPDDRRLAILPVTSGTIKMLEGAQAISTAEQVQICKSYGERIWELLRDLALPPSFELEGWSAPATEFMLEALYRYRSVVRSEVKAPPFDVWLAQQLGR
jgi:hypothetical protein